MRRARGVKMKDRDKWISIIGLGKLGACMAACLACKGYRIIGIDSNRRIVEAINKHRSPHKEPNLQAHIDLAGNRLKATSDIKDAIRFSDITFIVLPTPSKKDGSFSDEYLRDVLKLLSKNLKESKKKYHLFVITSTLSPGTIEKSLIPLIEKVSNRRLNVGFGIGYNPEFIALGTVIRDFLSPDFLLIGESDKFVGNKLEKIYSRVCKNRPYIARMSIIGAEITKISLNSYITMKISFANTLANLCEKIPEADVDAITKALGMDKRISPYYIRGGPSYGGPCFPRDNRAFINFAKKCGLRAKLAKATDEVNKLQTKRLANLVLKNLSEMNKKNVSILGLAYKPATPVLEESVAVKLINQLLKRDIKVNVYDPLAMDNARLFFKKRVSYASSVKDCISRTSLCVITSPLDEFRNIDGSFIAHNPAVIIDCWRILDRVRFRKGIKYISLGKVTL